MVILYDANGKQYKMHEIDAQEALKLGYYYTSKPPEQEMSEPVLQELKPIENKRKRRIRK
jgi:hypothetical protein